MNYLELRKSLRTSPRTWVVTGAAGFIGSNLVEALLSLDQSVVGLDNFSTGHQRNLDEIENNLSSTQWKRFLFREGDVRESTDCRVACEGADVVLHQAALGSVPRSIDDPVATHASNVTGSLNMLVAARDAGIARFVYAASSSTYGDHPGLPKVESVIGKPLSPYAVSKYAMELYAEVFARCYGYSSIGLRYFNVFGRRQDPHGAYSAVIPKWISAMMGGEPVHINGDGTTSRDFCYVDNVIQANLRAASTSDPRACNQIYNVAVGDRTTLNDLFAAIRDCLVTRFPDVVAAQPVFRAFRAGDVMHSLADISKARSLLGYEPTHRVSDGLVEAIDWYASHLAGQKAGS